MRDSSAAASAQSPGQPSDELSGSSSGNRTSAKGETKKLPLKLHRVFVLGFIASLVVVWGMIWIFAAYETGKWWWPGQEPKVSQDKWFEVVRNAVTAAAALGVGVSLFFSYRRQQTAEETQRIGAEAQQTAAKAQQTSAKAQETAAAALELSNKQHELDQQRRLDALTTSLRERYAKAAEQLGSSHLAVRLAGIYSLAALADDWAENDNEDERQVCIDLLCAYFRSQPTEDAATRKEVVDATVQVVQERIAGTAVQRKFWGATRINLVRPGLLPAFGPVRLQGNGSLSVQEALVSRRRIRDVEIVGGQFKILKLRGIRNLLSIFNGSVSSGGRLEIGLQVRDAELPKPPKQPIIMIQNVTVTNGTIGIEAAGAHLLFTGCTFESGAILDFSVSRENDSNHLGRVTFRKCKFKAANVFGIDEMQEGDERMWLATDMLTVDDDTTFENGAPRLRSFVDRLADV